MSGRVLVVGPGRRGRGGIAAVIELHRQMPTWRQWNATLLPTYDDRGAPHKIASALCAYGLAPFRIARASLVHVHLAAQVSLLRKLPIVGMARLLRRPVIVHLHAATEEALFERTPRWAVRFVFRSAARVVALSQSWAAAVRHHLPGVPVAVLPNPVAPCSEARRAWRQTGVVLLVGKLEARKGYADLLRAAQLVLRERPATQFWFAGHGEVENARALSRELGIEGAVRLLGWLDGPALQQVYAQTAVLALPSYGEGVPMSVLEAMSHGIPVVCTPVGGIPEWIDDGENGLLVAPGDIAGLAARLLRLLRDPGPAATMGEAGRQTVERRCTLTTISNQLDALYRDVLRPAIG